MKKFVPYILMVLLYGLLTACGHIDENDGLQEGEGTVQVAFVLDLENHRREASAFRKSVDKIGNDFETWIHRGSLQVLIFTGKDEGWHYIGKIKDLIFKPLSNQDYRFQGTSSVALKVGNTYRFMVMANCGAVEEIPSGEGLVFTWSDIQEVQGSLPLWGMTSHTIDFSPVQYLETIHLLRGVAKISVKLSSELKEKGYRLSDVRLSPVALQGYAFPKIWQTVAQTNEVMSEEQTFHPDPTSSFSSASLTPCAGDSSEYVVYVPEYDNVGSGKAAILSLKVRWNDLEEAFDEAIEFKHYVDGVAEEGSLHNIIRNHAYEYVIRQIDIGYGLSLESKVVPWTLAEETWDYTDHVSVRSEGKMKWVKGTYERIDRTTGSVVMIPGTSMVCAFAIDTPENAQWYASFIPVSGVADAFRFETFATNEGRQATGKVGEPVVLHIKSIHPATEQNNVARLRIVVRTRGGRTILVKNLLPDEFQNITEYTIVQSK